MKKIIQIMKAYTPSVKEVEVSEQRQFLRVAWGINKTSLTLADIGVTQ